MVAPTVSHPAATVTTDRPPPAGDVAPGTESPAPDVNPMAFSQVRTALIKALRSSPEAREPLCDALEMLETIQQQLEQHRRSMPPPAPPARSSGRSRARSQEYQVQTTGDGQFLTERRPGHSQPFRCPRATYDAAAEVLAGSDEALHFDELMERLHACAPGRQPDYRLRVALRFWLLAGAVERSRTKYKAAERRTFPETARRLWDDLAAKSGV
jgi:hypothetical protein